MLSRSPRPHHRSRGRSRADLTAARNHPPVSWLALYSPTQSAPLPRRSTRPGGLTDGRSRRRRPVTTTARKVRPREWPRERPQGPGVGRPFGTESRGGIRKGGRVYLHGVKEVGFVLSRRSWERRTGRGAVVSCRGVGRDSQSVDGDPACDRPVFSSVLSGDRQGCSSLDHE